MFAVLLLFQLPLDTDQKALKERAITRAINDFQGLKGLRNKTFIHNAETGEYGGFYVWETKEHFDTFLKSDSLKIAVEKLGQPKIKTFDILASIENGVYVPENI